MPHRHIALAMAVGAAALSLALTTSAQPAQATYRAPRTADDKPDWNGIWRALGTAHSTFARPWTASIPMTTNHEGRGVTSGQMFESACHEGNYRVENVLRGARAEAEAAEKAANKDSREE